MSDIAIEDHAFLSDCHSAALVTREGSVDWLCFPRFDSPSVCARLLDDDAGHLAIRPVGEVEVTRRYLEDSLVLETTFRHVERRPPERRRSAGERREQRVEAQLVAVALAARHTGLQVDEQPPRPPVLDGALDDQVRDSLQPDRTASEGHDQTLLGVHPQRRTGELRPDLTEPGQQHP